jgi:P27 family predicted phage terminase small subunit
MPARKTPGRLRLAAGLGEQPSRNLSTGIGTPDPPAHLPPVGRREWRRVVRAAASRPMWLQRCDLAALESYCFAFAIYRQACEALTEAGVTVAGRSSADKAGNRLVKHPAISIWRASSAELRAWCRELGFSPDARGRVDIGPPDDDERDDAARRLLS